MLLKHDLFVSASQVAKVTGVSHQFLTDFSLKSWVLAFRTMTMFHMTKAVFRVKE
jgi:hypothetical protein